jgi:hypothetical protein
MILTVSGFWALQVQKALPPTAEIFATDSTEPFLPKERKSGNITFEVQDITKPAPAEFINKFDLVNERLVLTSASHAGLPMVLQNLVSMIKPGGWFQSYQIDVADYSKCSQGMKDYFIVVDALFKLNGGLTVDWVPKLGDMLKEAGLENVQGEVFDLYMGKSARSAEEQRLSMKSLEVSIQPILEGAKRKSFYSLVSPRLMTRRCQSACLSDG